MRLAINLASRPYEDARQFWLRWGTALAAAGVLTLALLAITASGWYSARLDRATIATLRASIAERDKTRQQAEAFLALPENRTTRDESQFLNELIERKAFSWTRVLEDLETVMPPRVHLLSIHPELDPDNQLSLKMEVAGDSRDRALDLARRMEESKRFAQTQVQEGRPFTSTNGDTVEFSLNAIYVPATLVLEAPKPDSTKTDTKTDAPKGNGAKTEAPNTDVPKTEAPKPQPTKASKP
jgi:Tfp pilus assembly protein PilN